MEELIKEELPAEVFEELEMLMEVSETEAALAEVRSAEEVLHQAERSWVSEEVAELLEEHTITELILVF